MDQLPLKILQAFYAIEESRIRADIAKAVANPAAIHTELREIHRRLRSEGYSAELNVAWAHIQLVQAVALYRNTSIPLEFSLYHAVCGARRIAGESESVAMTKGRLADLAARMREMREAAGFTGDDEWRQEATPPAYQVLADEFSQRVDAVSATMIEEVLRRYSLGAVAELRECDELEFEIHFEIGRRVALSGTKAADDFEDVEDSIDGLRFTAQAWQRIRARVIEILGLPVFRRR